MITIFSLLLLTPVQLAASVQVVSVEQGDLGQPLAGADHLLIAAAARHREMREADLACYRIYVHDHQGARWVSFIEARERVIERDTADGREIIYLPPNPRCRSISFVMNAEGHVARVVYSRH